ncbi:probable 2-oxoglutarate-dependent dioxygenase AOP1 [Ricinus communis]|uniref:Gibberellin 20 oxidase, putative n=1 Tax=Ricinus communis TaxID=3988 RepID=B9RVC1_RICCO|nr:probable 2-oxoglutarate-dependent dioxygenase AOP1 [Ricinus communis]EEF44854.1 Gibberellin 20 oxidase, putative [Ricinus communis]|eukprot:XP_002517690.1 probable 2-oxoglutarate-dependent dioxygenase AOP1 [Ricinus communis]
MVVEAAPKLPALDFSQETLKPGSSCWLKACGEVRTALEEYGCFVVEYKKLSLELRDEVFAELKELFDLPTAVKMQNKCQRPLISYIGQNSRIPLHESMGIEDADTPEAAQNFTNLMWPNGNDRFSECIHAYGKLVVELDKIVTRMIFESYGLGKYHDSYVESTCYVIRLLKTRAPKEDETVLGLGAHTDTSFTTILHQNQVNGLEIDTKDGKKINVDFSPTSFVVMAGDALMAWSNDRIKSPRHQVIMNGKVDRYSMGLFTFNNGNLQVPEELVNEDHPLTYKPFNHIEFLHFYQNNHRPIRFYCGI